MPSTVMALLKASFVATAGVTEATPAPRKMGFEEYRNRELV